MQTTSFVIRKSNIERYKGTYCRLIEPTSQQGKEKMFLNAENRYYAKQDNFSKIPGSPVAYWVSDELFDAFELGIPLGNMGIVRNGMKTGDNNTFLRLWWEISNKRMNCTANNYVEAIKSKAKWFPYNKGGEYRKWYGNNEWVVNWEDGGKLVIGNAKIEGRHVQDYPDEMKFLPALTWSLITSSKPSFRYKENHISDIAGMSLYANRDIVLDTIGLLNTKVAMSILKILAPTINFQAGDIARIPYLKPKSTIKNIVEKCIAISKEDWDSFEISWNFKTHPLVKTANRLSEVFEQWEAECSKRCTELKESEEKLNSVFIDLYGLKKELTINIEDKDITIQRADLSRDIRSFVSYAVGCMFGRYSLDKEGLIYAGGDFNDFYEKEDLVLKNGDGRILLISSDGGKLKVGERYGKIKVDNEWRDVSFSPDLDNCLPITDEEYFSDDIVGRFVEFVKTVYGADTLEENLDFIARALGNKGDTSREVIRNYFLKDFYADHLKVYQKRPIYWLFDSGKENGFKALIYMHRYNADTVGRIRTDYLHRAQKYVETAMQSAQYTIENAVSASEKSKATKAVTKYMKQLAEMKIYDEAIAHIANQRIEIDLDDGVKVNYSKFQGVEVAQEGKKALKVDLLAKIK